MLRSQPYFSPSNSFSASVFKCCYPRNFISSLLPRAREVNLQRQYCVSVFYSADLVCHSYMPSQIYLSLRCCVIVPLLERTWQGMIQGTSWILLACGAIWTWANWVLFVEVLEDSINTQNKIINQNLLFWGKCPKEQGFEALHQVFLLELPHFSLNAETIFGPESKDNVAVCVCFCQVQQLQNILFFWCLWPSSERVKGGSRSLGSHKESLTIAIASYSPKNGIAGLVLQGP